MKRFGTATLLIILSLYSTTIQATGYFWDYKDPVQPPLKLTSFVQKETVKSYTDDDLDFLAQNLYFEERSVKVSDSSIAQMGYVVLNRVKNKGYKNTIEEVIWYNAWSRRYQKRVAHFSWTLDGKSDLMHNKKAKQRSFRIAKAVLERKIPNLVGDADHYLNRDVSKATWWEGMTFKGKHGSHWFYTR